MDRREFIGAVGLLIAPLAARRSRGAGLPPGLLHEASPLPTDGRTSTSGFRRPCASWATSKARTSSSNGATPRASSTGFLRWRANWCKSESMSSSPSAGRPSGRRRPRRRRFPSSCSAVDPVAAGFVTSLARPGGNITGVLILPGDTLSGKKLELLKEAVPQAARMALLAPADNQGSGLPSGGREGGGGAGHQAGRSWRFGAATTLGAFATIAADGGLWRSSSARPLV